MEWRNVYGGIAYSTPAYRGKHKCSKGYTSKPYWYRTRAKLHYGTAKQWKLRK